MAARNDSTAFLSSIRRNIQHCVNLLRAGNEPPNVIRRLEAIERNLHRSRGTLLDPVGTDGLLSVVEDLLVTARRQLNPHVHGRSGYQASMISTGEPHGPRFNIDRSQLEFLQSMAMTTTQMASALGVSSRTITRRLTEWNMQHSRQYVEMSADDLNREVQQCIAGNQNIGPNAVVARLRGQGVRVQRQRVRDSMQELDPEGAAIRSMSSLRLQRRTYSVSGPNALWHIDGYHKLIRWNFVIHGGIDGHSRLIVFMLASDNNRAATVGQLFRGAVEQHGLPSRVRTDDGGENVEVWRLMTSSRGAGSAIRGQSVHNQRIERLWVDLRNGVSSVFYRLFSSMEAEHVLDPENAQHMWALHYVFMPRINRDISRFVGQWNHHSIRTEGHRSPLQLFALEALARCNTTLRAMQDLFSSQSPGLPDPPPMPAAPRFPCPLSAERLGILAQEVDPLEDDGSFGIVLFARVLRLIE